MKIYNTMSKQKEELKTIEEGVVRMYVCGPTVYNLIHIGNARPMIVFDTVRRYMEYKGLNVLFVSNFTDIDDKIINKAMTEGTTAEEIAVRYIEECKKDMQALNVMPATVHPLATLEIGRMVDLIKVLEERGYTYTSSDGTVYFKTRRFKGYGKLSHKNLDDLVGGKRELFISGENQKEDALDFVLWKPKKEGEPYWESPWSEGRPGWHIECSAMSRQYLGDEIDIHAGGEDLIFPHHENEIAQSEAATGKPFARYWLHNAFLNIDNKKMSKSSGNFFTVRDIGEKYDLQVLRFVILSVHYRSPLNFSEELMQSGKNGLERIINTVLRLEEFVKSSDETVQTSQEEGELLEKAKVFTSNFEAHMDDDFNTADAISDIFELVTFINTHSNAERSKVFLETLLNQIRTLMGVCGILAEKKEEILDTDIAVLIEERQEARKNKDFKRADEIRNELLNNGILLEDTKEGVKWKRT